MYTAPDRGAVFLAGVSQPPECVFSVAGSGFPAAVLHSVQNNKYLNVIAVYPQLCSIHVSCIY